MFHLQNFGTGGGIVIRGLPFDLSELCFWPARSMKEKDEVCPEPCFCLCALFEGLGCRFLGTNEGRHVQISKNWGPSVCPQIYCDPRSTLRIPNRDPCTPLFFRNHHVYVCMHATFTCVGGLVQPDAGNASLHAAASGSEL